MLVLMPLLLLLLLPIVLEFVVALPGPAKGVVGFIANHLGLPAASGGGVLKRGGNPRCRGRFWLGHPATSDLAN